MEEIKLDVQTRNEIGTRNVRKIRRGNYIPGVVYGGEEEGPTVVKISRSIFEKVMRSHQGENVIFHLNVLEGDKKLRDYPAITKEVQRNPVSHSILHVDFNRISLTQKIEVDIPIGTKGEPVGVKKDGGSLEHLLWKLTVRCLPTQIPQSIELDVSNLNIHDSLCVKDIVLPEGVETRHDPQARVVTVVPPMKEEVVQTAPAPELEVIKEKKEKEGQSAKQPPEADKKSAGEKEKEKEK